MIVVGLDLSMRMPGIVVVKMNGKLGHGGRHRIAALLLALDTHGKPFNEVVEAIAVVLKSIQSQYGHARSNGLIWGVEMPYYNRKNPQTYANQFALMRTVQYLIQVVPGNTIIEVSTTQAKSIMGVSVRKRSKDEPSAKREVLAKVEAVYGQLPGSLAKREAVADAIAVAEAAYLLRDD